MYQLLTEHVDRLKRWGSLKAYWILNAMEIVFWAAVAFMMIQGNQRICIGTSCAIGWVVCVLAICMRYVSLLSICTWLICQYHGQICRCGRLLGLAIFQGEWSASWNQAGKDPR